MFKTDELLPLKINVPWKRRTLLCLSSHLVGNRRLPCGFRECPYDEKFCRKVWEIICGKTAI